VGRFWAYRIYKRILSLKYVETAKSYYSVVIIIIMKNPGLPKTNYAVFYTEEPQSEENLIVDEILLLGSKA